MRIAEAETSFRRFLETRGLRADAADAVELILALIDWYEAERAEDAVPIKEDGDQLLFEWGTFGAGRDAVFEVAISRQFIGLDEEQPIRQMALAFRYPATDGTSQLYDDAWWCRGPEDVPGFRDDIVANGVVAHMRQQQPDARSLGFGATD
jgi:hypothetical protein